MLKIVELEYGYYSYYTNIERSDVIQTLHYPKRIPKNLNMGDSKILNVRGEEDSPLLFTFFDGEKIWKLEIDDTKMFTKVNLWREISKEISKCTSVDEIRAVFGGYMLM